MNSTTGLKSFSGIFATTGLVGGVLSALEAVLTPGTSVHTAVYGGGGIIAALVSILGKLFHDKGIHVATIQQGVKDIAQVEPAVSADLSTLRNFIETDWPASKALIQEATARVSALEASAAKVVAPVVEVATPA